MTVSLITTVLNERSGIAPFIGSLLAQTRVPDEIVILDGGSSDGTQEYLEQVARETPRLRLIVDPTCNIRFTPSPVARGRNRAIAASRGAVIAVTDAGCTLDRNWLEEITRPFAEGEPVDVVGGWYEPWTDRPFERAIAAISFPATRDEMQSVLSPSSRSIAFSREIWERAGGYPEVVLTAEDTLFNRSLQTAGARYRFAERAIVRWRPRGTVRSSFRQFYRYSRGDAISGVRGTWHAAIAARFSLLGGLFLMALLGVPWTGYAALFLMLLYAARIARISAYRRAFPVSLFLKVIVDGARILGYIAGLITRLRGKGW